MRTKEHDVNLNGRRLSIVRLKDGAIVAEAEIPVDATGAVVAVLQTDHSTAGGDSMSAREPEATPQKKTTTRKTTSTKKTTANDVQSVQTT